MASIFTYQDEPHRVHSPWSTPGSSTPQIAIHVQGHTDSLRLGDLSRTAKLEPEKHDGPIEYKLHLLLRWRRTFTYSSTSTYASSPLPSRESFSPFPSSTEDRVHSRPSYQPSSQARQSRLQQLTTQLLWRLQQSSPFHSSSNAKLVLPVLPEATPRLGLPDRPSKLLPGLEESQGALYEIGVADDGTLVGLADEELEESLTNLRAMAASLGCVVDVHRRVIVGDCEWLEESLDHEQATKRSSKLWVAEVLVRPDNKSVEVVPSTDGDQNLQVLDAEAAVNLINAQEESPKQFLRVTLLGASAAGKSSLLGTLTTSVLDNGRGKSRLSLLKHRHEIASGITSSVAQELLGYQMFQPTLPTVVNYATGNVSSWPDIHNLANRLVFLSDSPGLPRYAKSTFRALISWDPAWAMLCIAANAQLDVNPSSTRNFATTHTVDDDSTSQTESDLSLAHLELCLKLDRPLIVVITKMDLATRTGLRQVLAHVLSLTKAAGKSPVLVNTILPQSQKDDSDFAQKVSDHVRDEQSQIDDKLSALHTKTSTTVPIVMTSAVTGSGIGSLHCLLRSLPERSVPDHTSTCIKSRIEKGRVIFRTDEVFAIPPSKVYSTSAERAITDSGVVLCGILDSGTISLGDDLLLGPFMVDIESNDSLQARAHRRASSHQGKPIAEPMTRSLSETFSKSLQLHGRQSLPAHSDTKAHYVKVRVVSLRNLRLPVSTLKQGDTGTVGIQTVDADTSTHNIQLNRARKGMILTHSATQLRGYSSFTATFPYSDFGNSASPPLILGGHAIVYINSIRSAVKVIAVALDDNDNNNADDSDKENTPYPNPKHHSSHHDEVFSFDDDDEEDTTDTNGATGNGVHQAPGHLKISFRFVSTVEYLEKDDQVLVVPNVTAAGPISGPTSSSSIAGLSGFVGRICEMTT